MRSMRRIRIRAWVKVVFFLTVIISCTYIYSRYIEPKLFKINEYGIIDSNMPSNFHGFKIVHISDIHYKTTIDKEELHKIINNINMLKPDIVILSGDIFYNGVKYSEEDYNDLKEELKSIDYSIGKYAIKGDNDYNNNWDDVISYSGFINLNDKYEFIYNEGLEPILLVGISSNYNNNHIKDTIDSIYSEIKTEYNYSILVLHEPDFINYIDYSEFNLILGGHCLDGQIKIPLIGGIIKDKYCTNYYDNNYNIYISNGIGTNKHKVRFLNTPSVNFYRLRNE